MATALESRPRLDVFSGEKPMTTERRYRALQGIHGEPGESVILWPKGAPGGGIKAAHLTAYHFANYIMSLATPSPTEAPEAALALRHIRRQWSETSRHEAGESSTFTIRGQGAPVTVGSETLQDALARIIDIFSDRRARDAYVAAAACRHAPHQPEIVLSFDPPYARITEVAPDLAQKTEFFGPAQDSLPGTTPGRRKMRREAIVPFEILVAAGELWEDTKARRGGDLLQSVSGNVQSSTKPETKNGAPGRAPLRDQNRQSDPCPNNTGEEAKRDREKSQPLSRRGFGPSLQDEGATHDPRSHPAHASAA